MGMISYFSPGLYSFRVFPILGCSKICYLKYAGRATLCQHILRSLDSFDHRLFVCCNCNVVEIRLT